MWRIWLRHMGARRSCDASTLSRSCCRVTGRVANNLVYVKILSAPVKAISKVYIILEGNIFDDHASRASRMRYRYI